MVSLDSPNEKTSIMYVEQVWGPIVVSSANLGGRLSLFNLYHHTLAPFFLYIEPILYKII